MREIRKHIVHCSDSLVGDVAEIRRWHIARGWKDVGYHFVIRADGEIEVGRTLDEIGAHCDGQNVDSVGTCLVGKKVFSGRQFAALRRVHGMLAGLFPGMTAHGHCEFNHGKTCPNFNVQEILG